MALSDLARFNEYAYSTMTEVLRQQIDLFNGASGNTIVLQPAAHQGDYSESAFFAKISGLVRRRNAYGSGSISSAALQHLQDVSVKVAAGTKEMLIDPAQYRWIQESPDLAGVVIGQQLAKDAMADMLNVALGCSYAALVQVTAVVNDVTGNTSPNNLPNWVNLNATQAKFGDMSSEIAAWIMHSGPMHILYQNNLTNGENLFNYGTVNVIRDPFGKLLIMTDSSNLVNSTTYHILGLVPGAVSVGQNNDFDANIQTTNGEENIGRSYQAEWSYNVGVKGFKWDKGNGGASPTDAALFTSTNWDRTATSVKDLAGVVLEAELA